MQAFRPAALALLMLACGTVSAQTATPASAAAAPIPAREFARSLIVDLQVPAADELYARSQALKSAVNALCSQPDAATLQAARDQYAAVLLQWQRLEGLPVGPTNREQALQILQGPGATLDKLATLTSQTPEQPMVDGQAADVARALPAWGIGLPVLETYLYNGTPEQSIKTLKAGKNCSFVAWQAQVINRTTYIVDQDWNGLARGLTFDLAYPRQFERNFVAQTINALDALAHKKTGKDHWLNTTSGLTAQSLNANVAAMRVLFSGDKGTTLKKYLLSRNQNALWQKIDQQLTALETATAALNSGLSDEKGKAVASSASNLATTFRQEIPAALGL